MIHQPFDRWMLEHLALEITLQDVFFVVLPSHACPLCVCVSTQGTLQQPTLS